MKAIVCTKYGSPDVLRLQEVEKPTPKDDEVLIRIHAATVTSGDSIVRSGKFPLLYWLPARIMFGLTKPRRPILGHELAGEIESVGKDVTQFQVGDQVYAATGLSSGTYAEYICLPEKGAITLKPDNLTYEEAAAVPVGAATALFFLKEKGNIQSEQKVLIYGASGSVGTYAVQLAKHFGADVTGVASTANQELVKSLGADAVIDYTKEDFTGNGETYDIIFDTVGKCPYSRCKNSIQTKAGYVSTHSGTVAPDTSENLVFLKSLIEEGGVKPVIDKRYPLEKIPEAHEYVDTGHKKGNVVITVGH